MASLNADNITFANIVTQQKVVGKAIGEGTFGAHSPYTSPYFKEHFEGKGCSVYSVIP